MKRARRIHQLHGEKGQVLVIAALLALGLIGMIGLVVDGGYLVAQRRQGQNAADSAALAGARMLFERSSVSVAEAAAREYANANGFDELDGNTVDVHIPPQSGEHIGDGNFVEVVVRRNSATFFIKALVPGDIGVAARGVAGVSPWPEEYAIVALNPTDCRSFDQGGSASLTVTGGGIMVNSSCTNNAMSKGGSGTLTVDGRVDVHGGYNDVGTGAVDPPPEEDVPWTIDDPLAGLPVPALGAPAPGSPGTAASPSTWKFTSPGTWNLQPGTYYGGLDINCSGCTITLAPGVYIMAGGGFSKQSNPTITGTDVTIYLTDCNGPTNTASCSGDGRPKPLLLTGGGTFALDPPDSGPYQGVTFWQDKLITNDVSISGANSQVQGIFYAPGARIDMGGGTDLGVVQIVADKVNFSGSSAIDLQYGGFRQFEKPDVVLVE